MFWLLVVLRSAFGPEASISAVLDRGCGLMPNFMPDFVSGFLGCQEEVPNGRRLQWRTVDHDLYRTQRDFQTAEMEDPLAPITNAIKSSIPGFVGQLILTLVIAFLYKSKVTDMRIQVAGKPFPPPMELPPPFNQATYPDFYPSTFSCCDHIPTCLCSFCFWPIRMGDTYASLGLGNYWVPLVIMAVEPILGPLVWIFLATWRMKLRMRLGYQMGGTCSCVDCLCMGYCRPCVVAQEARAVDIPWGLEYGCPWTIINKGNLVGQPLMVQQGMRP